MWVSWEPALTQQPLSAAETMSLATLEAGEPLAQVTLDKMTSYHALCVNSQMVIQCVIVPSKLSVHRHIRACMEEAWISGVSHPGNM